MKDDDNTGELSVKVDFGSASSFLRLAGTTLTISDISNASKVKPGSHYLKIILNDSVDSAEYSVMLLVF